MKNISRISLLSFFCMGISAAEFDFEKFNQSVVSVQPKRYVNSFISFVKDNRDYKYVIKQYKYSPVTILLATTVTELVAIELGHRAGIPIDSSYLIPAGVRCQGKETAMPASLHIHVPGIRFDKYKGPLYKDIMICQKDNHGLTRAIITHMSCHKDIAKLVAYDTLIGNNDRNSRNYFYDEATDSFMGIDMGAAFRRDLCKPSQETIKAFLREELPPLSQEERAGLEMYVDTLKTLVLSCSVEFLCQIMDDFAQRSHICDEAFFPKKAGERFRGYLDHCKRTMRKSYHEAELLIELIYMLLEEMDKGENAGI